MTLCSFIPVAFAHSLLSTIELKTLSVVALVHLSAQNSCRGVYDSGIRRFLFEVGLTLTSGAATMIYTTVPSVQRIRA